MEISVGSQIKNARLAAGMSQEDLAQEISKQTKIGRVQLGNYEKDKHMPPFDVAAEIAKILHVELSISGFKITPSDSKPKSQAPTAEQLHFAFGKEHKFSAASISITKAPATDGIVLMAIFEKPKAM